MEKDLIVYRSPKAPISESFRMLRTNILYLCENIKNKSLIVTSSIPGEGKSWVSSNLGVAFAQANQKTIIVDADLRKGRQHRIFNRFNKIGLSDYLKYINDKEDGLSDNEVSENFESELLAKAIVKTEVPGLYLMPSGAVPSNPSELLGGKNIDKLLETLKQNFDIILFDMPPVNIVTDSLVICKKVDYVILVSAFGEVKKDMLVNSKKMVENVGGKLAGVVLNKMPSDKRKEYNKYYAKYDCKYNSFDITQEESNVTSVDLKSTSTRRRRQVK